MAGTPTSIPSTSSPAPSVTPPAPSPQAPPRAPKRPGRSRSFHGESFADPWEWLRDKSDPEVLAHLTAENAWTDRVSAPTWRLQRRIVGELHRHTVETDVTVPVRLGDFWYYDRTTEGRSYAAHYRVPVRTAPSSAASVHSSSQPDPAPAPRPEPGLPLPGEQLLVDENREAEGRDFFALADLAPSPDGSLIAWSRDLSGDERWTIVVQDAATGEVVDDTVQGAGQGLAWSADSQTLLYARVDDAWRQNQVWTHRVGSDPAGDRLLLQEDDEHFELWFEPARDPRWVPIHAVSTTTSEAWLWSTGRPGAVPAPVTGRTPGVLVNVEPAGDHLVIVHTATSREGTLAVAPLPRALADSAGPVRAPFAPPSSWVSLREADEGERILWAEAYRTFLLLTLRSGGLTQVEVRTRQTPAAGPDDPLPARDLADVWGPARLVGTDHAVRTISTAGGPRFEDATARVEVESITRPPRIIEVDPATGARTVLRTLDVPAWEPGDYAEERVWVAARDGRTRIPVTLVHRRDAEPDGTAPGWLYGYGAYEVSIDPEFSALRLPLLERGVTYAIAHVRGGGEMGRAWYEDGRLALKRHTFEDFVDVARWMVDAGWAAPGRLVAEGRSAGGLLMGAAANMAPDLFRVVLAGVPFVDALTTILDPSLPLTAGEWEEWGNPIEDPEIYRAMRAYTPYENVRDGAEYPAVFATTSLNDTRVFFVEPAKWIQRLREATSGDPEARPIALRAEMVAGHAGRSGRYGRWESRAEEYAFALGQVGAGQEPALM
ncbi:S9 family peptidase [Schaalia naturae]|uniref:S9 family peptidase n=1 Tax=Schaalia naturae TaxID=635203 RepID=A0ABW2SQ02_9ACTO